MEPKISLLVESIYKLYRREAYENIRRILDKTHTADIAEIISHLSTNQRLKIFSFVKDEQKRAEVVSYLTEDLQKEILQQLPREDIHLIVSNMDSDDQADLLGHLDADAARDILKFLEKRDEVVDLIAYPEDSAGGLMSTDFLSFNQDESVGKTVACIQKEENDSLITFYIYVINNDNQIIGVLSLKQLLLAKPHQLLKDLMRTEVIYVSVEDAQKTVAKKVEKYDFLSIPVVDSSKGLVGIITVDDVVDVIRAEAEGEIFNRGQIESNKEASFLDQFLTRFSWIFLSSSVGIINLFVIHFFLSFKTQGQFPAYGELLAFLPFFLATGGVVGTQVITSVLWELEIRKLNSLKTLGIKFFKEFALVFSNMAFVILLFFIAAQWTFLKDIVFILIASLCAQSLVILFLGVGVLTAFSKIGLMVSSSAVPFFITVTDLISVLVLLVLLF